MPKGILFSFALALTTLGAAAAPAGAAIRVLMPASRYSAAAEKELAAAVAEYNAQAASAAPASQVEILSRGDDVSSPFSTIREIIAAQLAGDLPDLAAIESSELPTLKGTGAVKPVDCIPFSRSVPVLVVNEEALFRLHVQAKKPPKTWDELIALARKLTRYSDSPANDAGDDSYSLAIPLEGPKGLWIFEGLVGKPLWIQSQAHAQVNRAIVPAIDAIQHALDEPKLVKTDETWDHSLQGFVDGRVPLLATSSDMLPYLAGRVSFRWSVAPLPQFKAAQGAVASGSDLVLLKDSPAARNFLHYLLSTPVAARLTAAGGFLPVTQAIAHAPLFAETLTRLRLTPFLKLARTPAPSRLRTSSPDVVKTRSQWAEAFRALFGEFSKRTSTEAILSHLDEEQK